MFRLGILFHRFDYMNRQASCNGIETDVRDDSEYGREPIRRQHRRRRSFCHHTALCEQNDPVAKPAGKGHIVKSRHRRQLILGDQSTDKLQHVQLMREIKACRGFVQQQQSRLLRERAGDRHALPFTTRQFRHRAVGKLGHLGLAHGNQGDRSVVGRFTREPWSMRVSPHQDHVAGGKPEITRRRKLGDDGNLLRNPTTPEGREWNLMQIDAPGAWRQESSHNRQQRRLAGPIRPDNPHQFAGLHGQIDAV
jgi:hypothetical protein